MVESIEVPNKASLVQDVSVLEDNPLDDRGIEELYDVWNSTENRQNKHLIVLAPWLAMEELDMRRPFFLGEVEHDDSSKGAILFSELEVINISILENKVWDQVGADETFSPVDITDSSDYIDDPGKMWMPRSQMSVFQLDQ